MVSRFLNNGKPFYSKMSNELLSENKRLAVFSKRLAVFCRTENMFSEIKQLAVFSKRLAVFSRTENVLSGMKRLAVFSRNGKPFSSKISNQKLKKCYNLSYNPPLDCNIFSWFINDKLIHTKRYLSILTFN